MLISYSHRFIFIHVAKVAGLSIKKALKDYAGEPEKFKIRRPPPTLNGKPNKLYAMWESMVVHAKALDTRRELGAAEYDNYYKFTFVRNPWDWQVSMYHFLLQEPANKYYDHIKAMSGFEEYLDWVVSISDPAPYPKYATKLQKDMLIDEQGDFIVDFVGRYESLQDDFAKICRHLKLNATLPHLNKSSHRDYKSYYNNHTRELVADHFREDIELFGYHFAGYYPDKGRTGSTTQLKTQEIHA